MNTLKSAVLGIVLLLSWSIAFAAPPKTISYQGYLKDATGKPVTAATSIVFSLYSSSPARNNPVWRETQSVTPQNGVYSVTLGSVTPLSALFNAPYYLGLKVGSDAEMALLPLASVPYALRAATAEGLTGTLATAQLADGAVTAVKLNANGCTPGQILKFDGSRWGCAADLSGSGTVTSVGTSTGLTGGPVTGSGTISLAPGFQLPQACAGGQTPRWNGSAWVCGDPGTIAGSITLPASTSPLVGNIMKGAIPFIHNYGSGNTFVGENSGNFTMISNINPAPNNPVTGAYNTAVGGAALYHNTTGSYNTATGLYTMTSNTTGTFNTAFGQGALQLNDVGSFNTATGQAALLSNTGGSHNTATGQGALGNNINGYRNTAIGKAALFSNQSGRYNTAVGYEALYSNSADGNTAMGDSALVANASGVNNTAVGQLALYQNTTGNGNIAIGEGAGKNLTTGHRNIEIAHPGVAGESFTIRIGEPVYSSHTYIAGIRGIGTANPDAVAVVIDSAGQLGTLNSSRHVKDDIADMGDASTLLKKLRPVTFHYKPPGNSVVRTLQYGLIAEEVAEVAPGLVAHSATGEIETVYYQFLAPMLLNEYQKQQRTIEALEKDRASLSAELERQRVRMDGLEEQYEQIAALLEKLYGPRIAARTEHEKVSFPGRISR